MAHSRGSNRDAAAAYRCEAFSQLIGVSPAICRAKTLLERVAASPASTVLLTGESGTGKDLAAKAIHFNSARADAQFVNITCSALPDTLLESELFGHERGAFTDAKQLKHGLLERGHRGTVFLDEIGEMSPPLQAKLLRFLEERCFRRIGGSEEICVDVRIIAATHRDLRREVAAGRFREDLFYRLNVLPIVLPPLRERAEDLALLATHFISELNGEFNKRITGLSPGAIKRLSGHSWPGNVRELRNLIERAMILAGETGELHPEDFLSLSGSEPASKCHVELPPAGCDLAQVERSLVVQALERSQWNQTAAARLLHLHRDQVRYRMKKFDIQAPEAVSRE